VCTSLTKRVVSAFSCAASFVFAYDSISFYHRSKMISSANFLSGGVYQQINDVSDIWI
jgi:hypothetical protein